MKDRARERYPVYLSAASRLRLLARKVYRQTMTRLQERQAKRRPLDPLLADGNVTVPWVDGQPIPNPIGAINKCARWMEEDFQRTDIKAIVDELQALKGELTRRGLRFTNTAGNFLARQYHPESEHGKLWEDAWVLRHAGITAGQTALDVGGASTIFSFYVASRGCKVVVVDNDWANCGTLLNASHVARSMGWSLEALDRDASRPIPFADGYFDRVFSICVLEHLPSWLRQSLMREIGRVLKPGGIAGFTTDYDETRPVLVTDKGLRFAYKAKLERDVIHPSGLTVYGPASWVDAFPKDTFLGAFFLQKPSIVSHE